MYFLLTVLIIKAKSVTLSKKKKVIFLLKNNLEVNKFYNEYQIKIYHSSRFDFIAQIIIIFKMSRFYLFNQQRNIIISKLHIINKENQFEFYKQTSYVKYY